MSRIGGKLVDIKQSKFMSVSSRIVSGENRNRESYKLHRTFMVTSSLSFQTTTTKLRCVDL